MHFEHSFIVCGLFKKKWLAQSFPTYFFYNNLWNLINHLVSSLLWRKNIRASNLLGAHSLCSESLIRCTLAPSWGTRLSPGAPWLSLGMPGSVLVCPAQSWCTWLSPGTPWLHPGVPGSVLAHPGSVLVHLAQFNFWKDYFKALAVCAELWWHR